MTDTRDTPEAERMTQADWDAFMDRARRSTPRETLIHDLSMAMVEEGFAVPAANRDEQWDAPDAEAARIVDRLHLAVAVPAMSREIERLLRLTDAELVLCRTECTSGCHADDCEHHGDAVPVDAHQPGDPHRYRITCDVCGEQGVIRLTVDPETHLAPQEVTDVARADAPSPLRAEGAPDEGARVHRPGREPRPRHRGHGADPARVVQPAER